MTKPPNAPKGLARSSGSLWRAVLGSYDLSAAEQEVLHQALVSLDRANEAAEVLTVEGLFTTDRYGTRRAHPATDLELRHRTLFARLVGQLGVNLEEEHHRKRLRGAKPGPKPRTAALRSV